MAYYYKFNDGIYAYQKFILQDNDVVICKQLIFLVLTLILGLILYLFWIKYVPVKNLACSGTVIFHKERGQMRLATKLYLNDSQGSLSLNGFILNETSQKSFVSRTIFFSSTNSKSRYSWTSTKIFSSIDEDISEPLLKKWLPTFYRENNKEVNLFIQKMNINSVILSGDFVPYYVCTQKH